MCEASTSFFTNMLGFVLGGRDFRYYVRPPPGCGNQSGHKVHTPFLGVRSLRVCSLFFSGRACEDRVGSVAVGWDIAR